jgi:hypothetical protein
MRERGGVSKSERGNATQTRLGRASQADTEGGVMSKEDIKEWALFLGVMGLCGVWLAIVIAASVRIFTFILGV